MDIAVEVAVAAEVVPAEPRPVAGREAEREERAVGRGDASAADRAGADVAPVIDQPERVQVFQVAVVRPERKPKLVPYEFASSVDRRLRARTVGPHLGDREDDLEERPVKHPDPLGAVTAPF